MFAPQMEGLEAAWHKRWRTGRRTWDTSWDLGAGGHRAYFTHCSLLLHAAQTLGPAVWQHEKPRRKSLLHDSGSPDAQEETLSPLPQTTSRGIRDVQYPCKLGEGSQPEGPVPFYLFLTAAAFAPFCAKSGLRCLRRP